MLIIAEAVTKISWVVLDGQLFQIYVKAFGKNVKQTNYNVSIKPIMPKVCATNLFTKLVRLSPYQTLLCEPNIFGQGY
jgi:hypothetical protein